METEFDSFDDWNHGVPNTADVIAGYKADWKRRGFPDVNLTERHKKLHGNLVDPVSQPINEAWLWVAVILQAISDLQKANSAWKKPCLDCHANQPFGHIEKFLKLHKTYAGHPFEWNTCPYHHTVQQCAARWFAGPDFEEVCENLNLDASKLRKQIQT